MQPKDHTKSEEFPKERYNILNGSIPLTEEEKESLRQDMKKTSEWLKMKFNIKN
jgi:hypothetical protein